MARRSLSPTTPSSRTPQLVGAHASLDELRREWRRLYGNEPPRISRDLLVLGIAYRLQEIEHGGLAKATLRKLRTLAKTLRATGRVGPTPSLSLKPGARLVRESRGHTHTVSVTQEGFEYAGTNYPSLTKIARKITGAHWSGPRFFGLPAKHNDDGGYSGGTMGCSVSTPIGMVRILNRKSASRAAEHFYATEPEALRAGEGTAPTLRNVDANSQESPLRGFRV